MDKEPTNKLTKLFPIFLFGILILGGIYALTISRNKSNTDSQMNNSSMPGMNHDATNTPVQSHRTYSLNMLSSLDNIKPGQPTTVRFNIKDEQGNVLKDLQIEHTKILHFIIVRKDLQQFQHIHPDFDQATGEFTIAVNFPTDGPYRMFAEFTPKGAEMGSDGMPLGVTLNKDVTVGDMNQYKAIGLKPDTNILKIVDGYNINYTFPNTIKANAKADYSLIVEKPNETVKLEDYLGAKSHSVILKEGAVDYIHNHAGSDNSMQGMDKSGGDQMQMSGDIINFSTSFPEPGIYKVFTQFQVKGKVITSDYTVKVK